MFYKHWKKIALTLTALFWASCDNTSNEAPLYGVPACDTDKCDIEEPESSSDVAKPESSSSETSEAASSSSEMTEESSSSEFMDAPLYGVIACVPLDSNVAYFATDYSADNAKFWKKEEANHAAVDKIDSIKQTLAETPKCLEDLRNELDRFVALYGAPTIIKNAVLSCDDGTIRPSEEYEKFLKMKEEWEANKPALEEELLKVYEDKLKDLEQQINKCLNSSNDEIDK